MKEQKRDKNEFATKFVGIIVKIVSTKKILLKFLAKSFLQSVFSLITLKHKTLNKINCIAPSANPCQLCAH